MDSLEISTMVVLCLSVVLLVCGGSLLVREFVLLRAGVAPLVWAVKGS